MKSMSSSATIYFRHAQTMMNDMTKHQPDSAAERVASHLHSSQAKVYSQFVPLRDFFRDRQAITFNLLTMFPPNRVKSKTNFHQLTKVTSCEMVQFFVKQRRVGLTSH